MLVKRSLVLSAGLACLLVAGPGLVAAQPTSEQLQALQRLTPEQRAQLQKTLTEEGQKPKAVPLSEPEVVKPKPPADAEPQSPVEKRFASTTAAPGLGFASSARAIDQPLKQFGYDLFAGVPTTFAPATDIPVPADFPVGPGDTIQIQLFGKENVEHTLVVTREGMLQLPGIGPVPVAGQRFEEVKRNIEQRVARQMIGMKASITMGPLRSIRVFVMGDVNRPGSYTVSALSTMTNALFVSGGIKPIGSLRNVQLKRSGTVVTQLDLYDLLLRGDTSKDARLQPGDVIFVPPIGATVGIAGEVRRPAIYELRAEKTVRELVDMAGGLLPTAYSRASQLERINPRGDRTLIDIDLTQDEALQTSLMDRDVMRIYSTLERMDGIVLVSGHVLRPGGQEWHDGLKLTDVIPSIEVLLPKPDLDYVLIRREVGPERRVEVSSVRLGAALAEPGSAANVALHSRDHVFVFGPGETGARQKLVKPVVDELREQATASEPARIVSVTGLVRDPGPYPLESQMRLSDLLRAGGGLREAAYTLGAELTRHEIVDGQKREIAHIPVDLLNVFAGDAQADQLLRPYDHLHIKQLPQWTEQQTVEIKGEVRFPGAYPIRRGERLSSVLARAGGITDLAYPEGAVFMREELRRKEQEQIDTLTQKLEADIAAVSLERMQADPEQRQAYVAAKSLVADLKTAKAVGRLVIDLPRVAGKEVDPAVDVVLKDGDKLFVPARTQEVTVIGEVHYPTSHLVERGMSRDDYINLSGGITYKADDKRVYIVRANGSVDTEQGGWYSGRSRKVLPGDTIVVPLDAERMRPLTFWTSVSQIVYQIGVAAAAWKTVGVF